MKRILKMTAAILCVFFVCISLSFSFSSGKTEFQSWQSLEQDGTYQNEAVLSSDSDMTVSLDFIQSESETKSMRNYFLREPSPRMSALFGIFFLLVTSFFLWKLMKRAFLAYLHSYVYSPAQFLCELLIQHKKDGKKRLLAFWN